MKAEIALAAAAALCIAGGCIQVKTESEIKPIHITMDVNLKVEGSATRGGTTVPVNLDVTFHGDLDQLVNTGMKLRRKTR